MSIQRYSIHSVCQFGARPDERGVWVKYEDHLTDRRVLAEGYLELERQVTALTNELKSVGKQRNRLLRELRRHVRMSPKLNPELFALVRAMTQKKHR